MKRANFEIDEHDWTMLEKIKEELNKTGNGIKYSVSDLMRMAIKKFIEKESK